jgi:hypothetical protein
VVKAGFGMARWCIRPSLSRLLPWSGLWLASCLGLAGVGSLLFFDLRTAASLAKSHKIATGLVTRIDAHNHGAATVQWSVEGKTYAKIFGGAGVQAGVIVQVRYAPLEPWLALLQDPQEAFTDSLNYSGAFGVFAGTALAGLTLTWSYSRPPRDSTKDGVTMTRRAWMLRRRTPPPKTSS